ncbi:MAG: hypothetical protein QM724_01070 [Flavobacteriales bacterium]
MTIVHHPIAVICTFTWVGFVGAISFLEAWLKFRAPGVTLPIGLGIGRLVFGALNKVELLLAAAIVIDLLRTKPAFAQWLWIGIPVALLLLQTFWLLPALDARAAAVLRDGSAPPSQLHFVYVAFEVVKVAALVVSGVGLFVRNAGPILHAELK